MALFENAENPEGARNAAQRRGTDSKTSTVGVRRNIGQSKRTAKKSRLPKISDYRTFFGPTAWTSLTLQKATPRRTRKSEKRTATETEKNVCASRREVSATNTPEQKSSIFSHFPFSTRVPGRHGSLRSKIDFFRLK